MKFLLSYTNRGMAFTAAWLLALALTACASLGLGAPPKTFIESAVAAQLTATAVRTNATVLLNAGSITVKDAQNAQKAADAANEGVDIAVQAYLAVCPALASNGDKPDPKCVPPAGADAKLTAVVGTLTLLQSYLATQGAKK